MTSLAGVLIGVSSYPGTVVEGTTQDRRIHCDALRKHNYARRVALNSGAKLGLYEVQTSSARAAARTAAKLFEGLTPLMRIARTRSFGK